MADMETFVRAVAQQLGEPDPGVVTQIRTVIAILGPERCAVLVRCTTRLEELGGCLIASGSRRRTPGGIFMVLARACMSKEQRQTIWPDKTTNPPCLPQEGPVPSFGDGGTAQSTGLDTRIVAPALSSVKTERRVHVSTTT